MNNSDQLLVRLSKEDAKFNKRNENFKDSITQILGKKPKLNEQSIKKIIKHFYLENIDPADYEIVEMPFGLLMRNK